MAYPIWLTGRKWISGALLSACTFLNPGRLIHLQVNEATSQPAIIIGILFILTAVMTVIGVVLYEPILNDPNYLIKGPQMKPKF